MSKISELSDGGSLVSSDYLIAVRSGGNVKVRMDQINVDQVDLGDNEFIRLGNSQDLTMVHNASNSIINQAGIGDLLIQKAGATKLTINASGISVTGSVTADGLVTNGASEGDTYFTGGTASSRLLNVFTSTHDGAANAGHNFKIASGQGAFIFGNNTTANLLTVKSGGIDVTGSVTADGLTVDGQGTITKAVADQLTLAYNASNSTSYGYFSIVNNNIGNEFSIHTGGSKSLKLDANGDISFYEDTGTTPKFFWDASAESLGIGTSSVIGNLNLHGGTGDTAAEDVVQTFTRTSSTGNVLAAKIRLDSSTTTHADLKFQVKTTASSAESGSYYTDALTIKGNTGQVGIGTSSVNLRLAQKLDISTSANYGGMALATWSTSGFHAPLLDFNKSASATVGTHGLVSNGDDLGFIVFRGSDGDQFINAASIGSEVDGVAANNAMFGNLVFYTNGGTSDAVKRMTIDASGNVGIGVVPENSSGTWRNLQFGGGNLAFRASGANDAMVGTGYLFKSDNSEVYKNTEAASRLFFDNSTTIFQQAASGTAGTAITWTNAMTLDASGTLLVGTTSATGDTANDNPVVAGRFTTKNGVTSGGTSGSTVTLMTFGSNEGNFLVSARASGTGAITDNTTGIIHINNSASSYTALAAGSKVVLSMSGLSLQVTQTVFTGANISWNVVRIS